MFDDAVCAIGGDRLQRTLVIGVSKLLLYDVIILFVVWQTLSLFTAGGRQNLAKPFSDLNHLPIPQTIISCLLLKTVVWACQFTYH